MSRRGRGTRYAVNPRDHPDTGTDDKFGLKRRVGNRSSEIFPGAPRATGGVKYVHDQGEMAGDENREDTEEENVETENDNNPRRKTGTVKATTMCFIAVVLVLVLIMGLGGWYIYKIEERISQFEKKISQKCQCDQSGVDILNRTIEQLKQDINKWHADLTSLNETANFTSLHKNVTDLNANLTLLNETFSDLGANFTTLDKNVTDFNSDLTLLNETFSDLGANFTTLDKNVTDLNSNLTLLNETFSDLGANFTTLDKNVTYLNSNLTLLNETVLDLGANFTKLDKNVTDLSLNLTLLNETVSDLKNNVTDLNGNFTKLNETVSHLGANLHTLDGNVTVLNLTVDGVNRTLENLTEEFLEVKNKLFTLDSYAWKQVPHGLQRLEKLEMNAVTYNSVLLYQAISTAIIVCLVVYGINNRQPATGRPSAPHSTARNFPFRPVRSVLDDIQVLPLENKICLISFYTETQAIHKRLIDSVCCTVELQRVPRVGVHLMKHEDIPVLPRAKIFLVFVDFNERDIILENPDREVGDLRLTTVQGARKMGGDVFVVYIKDKGSRELTNSQLYNPRLTSINIHKELSDLNRRQRVLTVYDEFTLYQCTHLAQNFVKSLH